FFDQGDFAGVGHVLARRRASRMVETQEARAGEDRFDADPPKRAGVEMPPNRFFLRSERPEIHMSSLARQNEVAIAGLDQGRRAEAGAEPDNKLDAGLSLEGADRHDPARFEDRQTKSLCFEIIEKQALIEARTIRGLAAVDEPLRIGHLDGATAHRSGGAGDQGARLTRESGETLHQSFFETREIIRLEARPRL